MKDKIIHFLKTKGYYMVLALSVLTVGTISFLSYRISQKQEAETPLRSEESQNVEKVKEDVPDQREEAEAAPQATPEQAPPQVESLSYAAPLQGEIIAHYSPDQPVYSYTLKDWRTHAGIDVAAAADTQVLNVADGVVEQVAKEDLMGELVTVRHTDGKLSRYASLGSVSVAEGQMVKQGDPLGTVGRTMLLECGETDHLHYELWENDKPIDPSFMWNAEG